MKKRTLTKQKICEAAIHLVESDGLEALSMRKLAAQLNVEAASLYNHIAHKSELFDLIQEHLYGQLSTNIIEKDWKNNLITLASINRQGLLQIPKAALLFATRPTITSSSLKQADITLSVLVNAGFKPSEALSIFRNLHVFVLGHILAEIGQVPGGVEGSKEPSLNETNIDNYPMLKKTSTYKSNMDFDKGFKLGLQCMVNGLEILLRK